MTKQDLQKELLEKVKEGVKPSDLKKKNKKDEGYSSDEEKIPQAPLLPNQNLLDQITSLKKQLQTYKDFKEADLKIKEKLKKQLEEAVKSKEELEKYYQQQKKDLRVEINEKEDFIRELKEKNKRLIKTIKELKSEANNKEEVKQNPNKTFFCDNCQLTKQGEYIKRKVDSPFEPRMHGRICYLCSACSPYVKELSEVNLEEDNPYKLD